MANLDLSDKIELWKTVHVPYGYEVSNHGRVKNPRGRILSGTNKEGYRQIHAVDKKKYLVHRLVFEAFGLGKAETIDHINGIKDDNFIENLRPCSVSENIGFFYQRDQSLRHIYKTRCGKFQVRKEKSINGNKKIYVLGNFSTLNEAQSRRDKWLKEIVYD